MTKNTTPSGETPRNNCRCGCGLTTHDARHASQVADMVIDLGVYSRMAQRIRTYGAWPPGIHKEEP